MSVNQYLRKTSLIIGQDSGDALDLSMLRFRFSVRRGDLQTPNSADIRVYNVSPETANKAEKEFSRIVLQAGYEGNFGIIFDGTIKQIRRGRENPVDTYLDITAADGDSAYNYATINTSLAAGSTPKDHINAVTQAMQPHGATAGYTPELEGNPLPRGKVLYGMARKHARDIAGNTQTAWSIQDGKINFVPISAYIPGEIPLITSATGMVGLPEQTQNGIRVRMLLNPSIKISTLIKLDNASIQQFRYNLGITAAPANALAQASNKKDADGLYYVMVADHTGDTRGGDYYTDVICLATDATVPVGLIGKTSVAPAGPVKPYG